MSSTLIRLMRHKLTQTQWNGSHNNIKKNHANKKELTFVSPIVKIKITLTVILLVFGDEGGDLEFCEKTKQKLALGQWEII